MARGTYSCDRGTQEKHKSNAERNSRLSHALNASANSLPGRRVASFLVTDLPKPQHRRQPVHPLPDLRIVDHLDLDMLPERLAEAFQFKLRRRG